MRLFSVLIQLGTKLRTTLLHICCPYVSLAWFVQQQKPDYSLSVEPEEKCSLFYSILYEARISVTITCITTTKETVERQKSLEHPSTVKHRKVRCGRIFYHQYHLFIVSFVFLLFFPFLLSDISP